MNSIFILPTIFNNQEMKKNFFQIYILNQCDAINSVNLTYLNTDKSISLQPLVENSSIKKYPRNENIREFG